MWLSLRLKFTSLGAMREDSVMRFSGAPSFGPEAIVNVSPLEISLTTPLIHPELGLLFAIFNAACPMRIELLLCQCWHDLPATVIRL